MIDSVAVGASFNISVFFTLFREMPETKSDQRVNIKILVKLNKSETETYQMLLDTKKQVGTKIDFLTTWCNGAFF